MHQIERRGLLRLKVQRCTLIFYPRHAYAPLPNPAHRPRLPLAGRVFGDGRGDDFGVAGWGRTATAVIPLPRHKCLAEKLLQTRLVSYPLKLTEILHRRVPAPARGWSTRQHRATAQQTIIDGTFGGILKTLIT